MKKIIKKIVFAIVIIALVLVIGVVIKTGKFKDLEGYMYSLAAEIKNSATDCDATSSNATSSDAQECATSSNATSSDAQECATSSNATDCDATSSNAQATETIKVTNKKPSTTTNKKTEKVKEESKKDKTDLTYDNSDIDKVILEDIANSNKTQSITINLDDDVIISKDIFKSIKGKEIKLTINVGKNQIIFNGDDITKTKDINAKFSYNLVSEDALLKGIVKQGVVINFANNDQLPGKATIRIKVTDEIKKVLNMKEILVYQYDEETKELTQMASNAKYKEKGFIEFSIDHNSKYLFVNEIIEEKEYTVTTNKNAEVKDKVSFLESHKMYIVIIGVSVLAIVSVTIIVIVDKRAIAKRKAKANNNEKKQD